MIMHILKLETSSAYDKRFHLPLNTLWEERAVLLKQEILGLLDEYFLHGWMLRVISIAISVSERYEVEFSTT
jgi:hypothetical protein